MLRRSGSLAMRATAPRLAGGGRPNCIYLENHHLAPPASTCMGFFFKPYNGSMVIFRMLDFKWVMNRLVQLGRDGYIAAVTFHFMLWCLWWKGSQALLWADGAPPRHVTWNNDKTGYLPKGFTPTEL